jgi:hypothetical protein
MRGCGPFPFVFKERRFSCLLSFPCLFSLSRELRLPFLLVGLGYGG